MMVNDSMEQDDSPCVITNTSDRPGCSGSDVGVVDAVLKCSMTNDVDDAQSSKALSLVI